MSDILPRVARRLRESGARGLVASAVDRARSLVGLRPPIVSTTVLGQPLRIVEGTIRDRTDYDDAWFLACALHARVIFDVGANRGDMALLALLCPGVQDVVLVEPNPEALVIATENIVRNGLARHVRLVCAFASENVGAKARLWTLGSGAAGSMYAEHAVTARNHGRSIEVPTVTLDELAEDYGVLPDLVKIDVEGAERLVLAGSRRFAAARKTRFLVEMHSNPELTMESNAAKALAWCSDLGYAAWYLARGTRLESPEAVRSRGRCHFLLQPSDWPYPAWLTGVPESASLQSIPLKVADRSADAS